MSTQRSRQRSIGMCHNACIQQPWTPSLSISHSVLSLRHYLPFVLMQTLSQMLSEPHHRRGGGYMAHTLNGMITQQSIGHVQRRRERKDEALCGKIPCCHNMLGGGCRISEGQTRSPAIIMSFGAAKLCGVSLGEGSDRYWEVPVPL